MTLHQALLSARKLLSEDNIPEAQLRAELIVRHVMGWTQAQLYTEPDWPMTPEQESAFWKLVDRARHYEPAAYLVGHKEFYGLDFFVDSSVLIPRPETELLVEKVLEWARQRPARTMADIGTGSGNIAVAVAKNLPQIKIYATDISAAALEVARLNIDKYGLAERITLLRGNLLETLPVPVDIITANLPYVRKADIAPMLSARYEPSLALDGGADGLDKIRELCFSMEGKLNPGGLLLLEIGQGQGAAVSELLHEKFPISQVSIAPDLAGIERVVSLVYFP